MTYKAGGGIPRKALWAYAYEMTPPRTEDQLRAIRALLEDEHSMASRAARTWTAKLVSTSLVTHILVVSDSADQGLEINRRLEAGLSAAAMEYSLTAPMAVHDTDDPASEHEAR